MEPDSTSTGIKNSCESLGLFAILCRIAEQFLRAQWKEETHCNCTCQGIILLLGDTMFTERNTLYSWEHSFAAWTKTAFLGRIS